MSLLALLMLMAVAAGCAVSRPADAVALSLYTGAWQTWTGITGWATVPGDALARYVEEPTMVDEITEAEAAALTSPAEEIINRLAEAHGQELDGAMDAASDWLHLRPKPWGDTEEAVIASLHVGSMEQANR